MKTYHDLDCIIERALNKNKTISICPLGKNGMQVKNILNTRYGVKEKLIIDNFLCQWNPMCIPLDQIPPSGGGDVVIVTIEDFEIRQDLIKHLIRQGYEVESLFQPYYYYEIDEMFAKNVIKMLSPKSVEGKRMVRIGDKNDGGYVMLDDFYRDNIAYSIGIGDDWTWDLEMERRGYSVYMYDPTITQPMGLPENCVFRKQGLSAIDNDIINYYTLESIMRKNGHSKIEGGIIKVDIEGAEWEVFDEVDRGLLGAFNQIVMELHGLVTSNNTQQMLSVINKIHNSFQCVWVHGNNNTGAYQTDEYTMPDVLEVCFVNRNKYDFKSFDSSVQLLNAPNNNLIEDIQLLGWY